MSAGPFCPWGIWLLWQGIRGGREMYAHCAKIKQHLDQAREILVVADHEENHVTKKILTKHARRSIDLAEHLLANLRAVKFPAETMPN